jgi:hypothetical protein
VLSEGQRLAGDPESATAEPDGGRSRSDEDGGGDGS